jgi:hypothetical protein
MECLPINLSQGWAWARARWAIALGLTPKLGLIPNIFKDLIISKGLQKFIISPYTKKKKKFEKAHMFKTNL